MTFKFILPFGRLILASLSPKKREEIVQETGLIETKAVKVFEYGKNNDEYWDGAKLYQQVVKKALPIAEALYPGYSLLFLFDNATSHFVYAKDTLQAKDINKGSGGKQPILRDGWFDQDGVRIIHPMNFQQENRQWIQKRIQKVLEKRQIWPVGGQKLSCPKPKYFNCQVAADCKICVKGHKCGTCKNSKDCSFTNYSKNWRCDTCVYRKKIC